MSINEAAFAARISPIYRLTGESPCQFVLKYEEFLKSYIDTDEVIGILRGDPGYENLNQLLQRAIYLADAETDIGVGKENKGENLASVFSRISITDKQLKRDQFYRYNLNPLRPQDAFPYPTFEDADTQHLLDEFYKEMDNLSNGVRPKDYHALITCFDRISRKYMWCITASDYEGEDISLYDFMKITEAIMVCLVRCDDLDNPFTLVMGDFSGIQKYIFEISSQNNSGVTKRLRARSFYVDIVNVIFSHYIIDQFDVEQANILLQSGGKFYCIVPTINNTNELLSNIRDEFDQHLFKKFHGFVSVNLAWLVCSDNDIKSYSDSIVKLNGLLSEKKSTPFDDILKQEDKWETNQFVLYNDLREKHICEICGMELTDKGKDSCDMCEMQLEIGKRLPTTKYIVFTKSEKGDVFRIFKNYGIILLSQIDKSVLQDAYLIESLNNAEIDDIAMYPCVIKYMANHIPMDNYEHKTFSEIAETSQGMNKLAVLKADVDVLGFLFAQGLQTREGNFGTISRVNTMSRLLEVFFCGYVEELLEKNSKYNNVYCVFSGGDDLFLLGPWDVMLDLSLEIQKEFKKFTALNDSITLSAAVSIFDPKDHMAYMTECSESQLERAKKEELKKVYPNKNGRNTICVMGELISWEDYETQLKYTTRIAKMLKTNQVSISILRRIIQYSSMYKQYFIDGNNWQLMFAPLFFYDRHRNYYLNKKNEDCYWFMNQYLFSMENEYEEEQVNKNLYFAEMTVSIALNKTRKERN